MQIKTITSLSMVEPEAWNALEGGVDNPFLRHEFLYGLEEHGCVGDHWGWLPRHLLLFDELGLLAACPLYIKYHSYGELVFDWAWADAYQRAGLSYYPKLVSAIPYSPVGGARLLCREEKYRKEATAHLIRAALELNESLGGSSLHWLFPLERDMLTLEQAGMMRRTGTQFHWFNHAYQDFDDFLSRFSSGKRKKVRRERRRVVEQDIEIELYDGHRAGDAQWQAFFRFYRDTFDRHGGHATLTEPFFRHLGVSMPESVVLMLARHHGRYVAGALSLRSSTTLYGRHWGCEREYHSLHFELCYYQGIDYCIRHGLKRFEPGAQGEHKVGRGFEPVATWSAHWLAHPQFSFAVKEYLGHEQEAMQEYMGDLRTHLPYKSSDPHDT